MGYTTDFNGEFLVSPSLSYDHKQYLAAFATTRRMKRDPDIAATLPDPVREAVGLPIGYEAAYFVGGEGVAGQNEDPSVLQFNEPPGTPKIPTAGLDPKKWGETYTKELELREHALALGLAQPGLWCQWVPNASGTAIEWDEGEKFYYYIDWIKYLIAHFFEPWGYKLNGEVYWSGEEPDDRGIIKIEDNVVTVGRAVITYNYT